MRIQLANFFSDNVVLQRDAEATVWGWSVPGSQVFGALRPESNSSLTTTNATADANGLFRLAFPPTPGGTTPFYLVFSTASISQQCAGTGGVTPDLYYCAGATRWVTGVRFGDVFLCGGQSNMGVFVNFAFNASAELALANGLGGSVFLTQLQQTSASTSEALDEAVVDIPWSAASNTSVASFSATCWFSAKAVVLGRPPSAAGIPVGLVAFPFNGTPIKIHATPAANAANEHLYPGGNISVPGPDCNRNTPCGPSAAFNALIQPLLVRPRNCAPRRLPLANSSPLPRPRQIGPVRAAAMIWFQVRRALPFFLQHSHSDS